MTSNRTLEESLSYQASNEESDIVRVSPTDRLPVQTQEPNDYEPYSYVAVGTGDDATVVRARETRLCYAYITNINAALAYVKFYNKSTTPGTADVPVHRFPIPASATGAGFALTFPEGGLKFSAGLSFRLVTGVGDTDGTDITANETIVNLGIR